MNGHMGPMGPPKKQTWKEILNQLEVQISNAEKNLLLMKSQFKEVEIQIKEEEKKNE